MKTLKRESCSAEKGLLGTSLLAMAGLAIGLIMSNPARAETGLSGAERLHRLDIMLMVTGLRCRTTEDNFNAEYGNFTTHHMSELNQANRELRAEMSAKFGASAADRALDRLSTTMANGYGQGHPWLSCGELKMVTRDLAEIKGESVLIEAADQLLAREGSARLAFARR